MRRMFWLVLLAALQLPAWSGEPLRAVMEDGRRVLLAEDGRWKFDTKASSRSAAPVSPYQSIVKRFSLAFDPEKWVLVSATGDEGPGRQKFRHRRFPVHALIVAEETPARTEAMKNIIVYNATTGGLKPSLLLDEILDISGRQIGHIRMTATSQGVDFVMDGHYYADDEGNVQVMCMTGQQLFHKYEAECAQLLAGLTIR